MAKKDKAPKKSNPAAGKTPEPPPKPKSSPSLPAVAPAPVIKGKAPAPGTSLLVSGPPKAAEPAPKAPDPATTPTVLALPPVEELLKAQAKKKSDPKLKAVSKKKETGIKTTRKADVPPPKPKTPIPDYPSLLTEFDLHLLVEGQHWHAYEKLGAHPMTHNGVAGYHFAVWAPNAEEVSVIGDFNGFGSSNL